MKQLNMEREAHRIKGLKKEYEAKGYSVELEPAPSSLPETLKSYRPDMIARSEEDVVVIEVKSRSSLSKAKHLEKIASKVNRIPGWRFELVITNPRESLEEIDLDSIRERFYEAKKLLSDGYTEATLLILWSVVEALLRYLAHENRVSTKHDTPRLLVKKLYSEGLLNQREFASFEKLAELRNVVAHGGKRQKLSKNALGKDFKLVSVILRRVLEKQGQK